LELLGKKDMISVGEWVTYDVFNVTIYNMDENLKKIIKVFGDLMKVNLFKDYVFMSDVNAGVRNELQYFSPSGNIYIKINEIKMSLNLEKEINNIDLSKFPTKN
jgi:hypothetical protein